MAEELELGMVATEPDDVRVKSINGQWIVRVVDGGTITKHLFSVHAEAEAFAEEERSRLRLPGEPPTEDPAETMRNGRRSRR